MLKPIKNAMLSVAAVAALTSFATAANATTVTGNQAVFIQTSDDSTNGAVGNIGAKNTIVVTDKGGGDARYSGRSRKRMGYREYWRLR